MKKTKIHLSLFALLSIIVLEVKAQIANPDAYLEVIKTEMKKKWPANRTINLVFHGHSVPTGYFATPAVNTMQAYPHLLLSKLKQLYPFAVINIITTSIGGENAEQGEKRLEHDVLIHKPDVLFIDYALNDRSIGLDRSRIAMENMIKKALNKHIKVVLLTPSPDITTNILTSDNPLSQHTEQLIFMAAKYQIGLVNSFQQFKDLAAKGIDLNKYMAQSNHPNEKGHQVITEQLLQYFK